MTLQNTNQIFKYLLLLFTLSTYIFAGNTPRLDTVEKSHSELKEKLVEQKIYIENLKKEVERLKKTQYEYRIEKSSYDSKMKEQSLLVSSQDKRIEDINFYLVAWGVLITFILFAVFWKSNKDAIEAAQNAIEEWIKSDANEVLHKKMEDELEKNILPELKKHISKAEKMANSLLSDMHEAKDMADNHVSDMEKSKDKFSKLVEEPKKVSDETIKEIKAKEERALTSDDYYQLGIKSYNEDNLNTALNYFESSIEINPKNDDAYFYMGNVYYYKKEYDNAIISYEKAVAINPKRDEAYYNMGIAYDNKQEYDNAIASYEKAVAINPKNDGAYNNMGLAYDNKQEYDNAIASYEKAVTINPKKDEAYNNMGNTYYSLGNFSKSIESLIEALNINSKNSLAYVNLFELQLTQNQLFDEYLEAKYIELFQNQKESFIEYEMLKIFQELANGKEVSLEHWKQKYSRVGLDDWSFAELREWIDKVEDAEVKAKLVEALEVFEGHA